jgi:hypothetical protein
MNTTRKKGYYWVEPKDDIDGTHHGWQIAFFDTPVWYITKNCELITVYDSALKEIDERPIIRYDRLPKSFNVKKGMGIERHMLENYYVALPPLPMPNAETVSWVTIEKPVGIGQSSGIINAAIGYYLNENNK